MCWAEKTVLMSIFGMCRHGSAHVLRIQLRMQGNPMLTETLNAESCQWLGEALHDMLCWAHTASLLWALTGPFAIVSVGACAEIYLS